MFTIQPELDLAYKSPLDVIDILTPELNLEPSHNFPAQFQLVQFTVIEEGQIGVSCQPSTIHENRLKISEFLGFFQHSVTKIYKLIVNFVATPTNLTNQIFENFLSSCKKFNPDFQLKVNFLEVLIENSIKFQSLEHIFNATWQNLNSSGYLEVLKVNGDENGAILLSILNTEHWRHLKEFLSDDVVPEDVEIKNFNQLERISVVFERFSIEKFSELVESFKARDLSEGSCFKILSIKPVKIDRILNSPRPILQEANNHMLFTTTSDENWLDVNITQNPENTEFYGQIMSKTKKEPEHPCCVECCAVWEIIRSCLQLLFICCPTN